VHLARAAAAIQVHSEAEINEVAFGSPDAVRDRFYVILGVAGLAIPFRQQIIRELVVGVEIFRLHFTGPPDQGIHRFALPALGERDSDHLVVPLGIVRGYGCRFAQGGESRVDSFVEKRHAFGGEFIARAVTPGFPGEADFRLGERDARSARIRTGGNPTLQPVEMGVPGIVGGGERPGIVQSDRTWARKATSGWISGPDSAGKLEDWAQEVAQKLTIRKTVAAIAREFISPSLPGLAETVT
jgi:hypothetical protein